MRPIHDISLPAFYARQYTTKHTASEEILIFRWLQYMEQHRHLYAVKNKHQCFGKDADPRHIVQPFASVDYFFGCLECGKYHLCHLKRDSCEVAIDLCDSRQICRYSGRPLREQDNLALTYEDSVHFEHEACYFSGSMGGKPLLSRIETDNKSRKRTRDPMTKRRHIIDLFKEVPTKSQTNNHKRPRLDITPHLASLDIEDTYEISIDSIEEDGGEEEDPHHDGKTELQDDDEEEEEARKHENDNEESIEEVLREESTSDEKDTPCNNDHEEDHNNEDEDDENDPMVSVLIDQVNGDDRHCKNYHNNIRYHNEYYDFMCGTIKKQRRETSRHTNKKNDFLAMCNRDIREETDVMSTTTTTTIDTTSSSIKIQPLLPSMCERIRHTVSECLILLIRINKTFYDSPPLTSLVTKYTQVIENIATLVYHSPVLGRRSLIRDIKNHNQCHNYSLTSLDIDTPSPQNDFEHILSPQQICHALLLHAFLEAFSLYDDEQHRIGIWQPDPWLKGFNNTKTNRELIRDYFLLYRPGNNTTLALFKADIQETSLLIRESLEYYRHCPIWLRYRVYKLRAK